MISLRGNAAIHYLPLSESGASDGLPMQDRTSKADGVRHGFRVIAERPTGAGLTLGMGLRNIGGEAGRMIQRRRSLWSVAEPDGLGGVMPHLIGLADFWRDAGGYQSKLAPDFSRLRPSPDWCNGCRCSQVELRVATSHP